MLNATESRLYCQDYLDQIKAISLDNKYTKWYLALCRKAALRAEKKTTARILLGYIESHHIVPKSWAGDDVATNLAHFTAREHFVSHLLLMRLATGKLRVQLCCDDHGALRICIPPTLTLNSRRR